MRNNAKEQGAKRRRRAARVRARMFGTATHPRLSVFRSGKYLYAQLIDDEAGKTILSGSTRGMKKSKETKTELAISLGSAVALKAKEMGIQKAIFDRGAYKYHGRVRALADAARKAGLTL